MNERIAFPQLVELVAQKAGTTTRMSKLFLQELFATVSQELIDGKKVNIKGLGTFQTSASNDDLLDVTFTPDDTLASTVNAPFSQFKPVLLCDELTQEQLDEIDASMAPPQEKETQETVEDIIEEKNEEQPEKETVINKPHDEFVPKADKPAETSTIVSPQVPKKNNWLRGLLIGIAASVAMTLLVFLIWGRKTSEPKPVISAQTDSVKTSSPIITDTLTGNNVLTRMAKKHYGDQSFWVYIARENQHQYPNYHDIPTGTAIIIPPSEKYGINSDSKQSLRRAHEEAIKLRNELKSQEIKSNEQNEALESKEMKTIAKKHDSSSHSSKQASRHNKKKNKHNHHHR